MARLKWVSTRLFAVVAALLVALLICPASYAEDNEKSLPLFRFQLEFGPIWFSKNELTSPSSSGTTFDVTEGFDTDPAMYGRVKLEVPLAKRHTLSFWFSPTEFRRSGQFSQPVSFKGSNFAANTKTDYQYRYNDLVFGYSYGLILADPWDFSPGVGVYATDIKVTLSQEGGPTETIDEWQVLPLLNLPLGYTISPKWKVFVDLFGGATDNDNWAIGGDAMVRYTINSLWDITGGYVGLAQDFESTELKNSAVSHSFVLSVGYSFWR